jgi:hypothetical protein
MRLSVGGKVLKEKIDTCTCDYQSVLYFINRSTHPEKYVRTSVYRSGQRSGDIVGRIDGLIHMNLSLVVVWSRVILKLLDVVY